MLKARLSNVGEWRSVLDAIGGMVEDAMFICGPDGVTFRGMDAAHVALLDVSFPRDSFESFEAEQSLLGIKVADLLRVLGSAGQGDEVGLEVKGADRMTVSLSGPLRAVYTLRLLERDETNTPLPRVGSKARARISAPVLARVVSNVEKMSEHVSIETSPQGVVFSGAGDSGDVRMEVPAGGGDLSELSAEGGASSSYNVEYLSRLVRTIGKSCSTVGIEYDSKMPVKLVFEMPSKARVDYYLAPRTEG